MRKTQSLFLINYSLLPITASVSTPEIGKDILASLKVIKYNKGLELFVTKVFSDDLQI